MYTSRTSKWVIITNRKTLQRAPFWQITSESSVPGAVQVKFMGDCAVINDSYSFQEKWSTLLALIISPSSGFNQYLFTKQNFLNIYILK